MIIRGITLADLETAVRDVNGRFDNNITMPFEDLGKGRFKVFLQVLNSRGPGAHTGMMENKDGSFRATKHACWHVHGFFFDALPEQAVITAMGRKLRPNDPWHDWKRREMGYPNWESQMCECDYVSIYNKEVIREF